MQYKIPSNKNGDLPGITQKDDEGIIRYVPDNAHNRDWARYQAWLSEGNTPLSSDEEFE